MKESQTPSNKYIIEKRYGQRHVPGGPFVLERPLQTPTLSTATATDIGASSMRPRVTFTRS